MRFSSRWEIGVWALAAFLASAWIFFIRPQPLFNDSYQYLSVAENLRDGNGLATSLIHFNTERSHGLVPAPLTSFAPGYPVVIAVLGIFIPDLELAARWVSLLSMAATTGLLAWGMIFLGVPAFARHSLLCLFVTNAVMLTYATAVQSELLFLAFATAAILGLIRAPGWVPFVLIALSYIVRYAGMLLLVPIAGYEMLRLWMKRRSTPIRYFLLPLIPFVPFLAVSFRNWELTGTWKGGNEVPTYVPPLQVMADYVRANLHLMWGEHAVQLGVWEGLLILGLLGLAVLLFRTPAAASSSLEKNAWSWLGLCVGFYSAVMCYLGVRVTISFGTRMFQPMLPFYLCMAGLALSRIARTVPGMAWKAALGLLVIGSIGTNARDLRMAQPVALHSVLAGFYAKPLASGQSLRQWVEESIPASEAIVAGDGQATGFLLHRVTVSLLESHYSTVRWDCDTVLDTLKTFRARYVILYQPHVNPALPLAAESEFIRSSLAGAPPCGFQIAAQTPDITILGPAK